MKKVAKASENEAERENFLGNGEAKSPDSEKITMPSSRWSYG